MMMSKEPRPKPAGPLPSVLRIEAEHNPRHDELRKDIAKRLKRACSNLSEHEFSALVDKILKVQITGEKRAF